MGYVVIGDFMYDVKIINNEAILFDYDSQIENLEHLRKNGKIHYKFDDGNSVRIFDDNSILWYDSDGFGHRDGDMPAFICTNGYIQYLKHGKLHRVGGPAVIWPSGGDAYFLGGRKYTKVDYIKKLNSSYGFIYHV